MRRTMLRDAYQPPDEPKSAKEDVATQEENQHARWRLALRRRFRETLASLERKHLVHCVSETHISMHSLLDSGLKTTIKLNTQGGGYRKVNMTPHSSMQPKAGLHWMGSTAQSRIETLYIPEEKKVIILYITPPTTEETAGGGVRLLVIDSQGKFPRFEDSVFEADSAIFDNCLNFTPTPTAIAIDPSSTLKNIRFGVGFHTGGILVMERRDDGGPQLQKVFIHKKSAANDPIKRVSLLKWIPETDHIMVCYANSRLVVIDITAQPENAKFQPPIDVQFQDSVVWHGEDPGTNPISIWKTARMGVTNAEFSPSGNLLAVTSKEGQLRIYDYERGTQLCEFRSYYGAFLCVTWTPDSKYVIVGGEDDILSIWSVSDACLVARGYGHTAWISSVCVDRWTADTEAQLYRIASIGQDGKVLFWDYCSQNLRPPNRTDWKKRRYSVGEVTKAEVTEHPLKQFTSKEEVWYLEPIRAVVVLSTPGSSLSFLAPQYFVAGGSGGQVNYFQWEDLLKPPVDIRMKEKEPLDLKDDGSCLEETASTVSQDSFDSFNALNNTFSSYPDSEKREEGELGIPLVSTMDALRTKEPDNKPMEAENREATEPLQKSDSSGELANGNPPTVAEAPLPDSPTQPSPFVPLNSSLLEKVEHTNGLQHADTLKSELQGLNGLVNGVEHRKEIHEPTREFRHEDGMENGVNPMNYSLTPLHPAH